MSEITNIVERLETRLSEIRSELENLASKKSLSAQERERFNALISGYGGAVRDQLALVKPDEALGSYDQGNLIVVRIGETVSDGGTSLKISYARLPPIPAEALYKGPLSKVG